MPQLIVSMNLSLDGYIEAQGQDDGSWLRIDEAVHRAFNELAASAEAFLYGRKVYEVMIPYWPDAVEDATKPAHERDYGRIWGRQTQGCVLDDADRNALEHARGAERRARRGSAAEERVEGDLLVTGALSSCRILRSRAGRRIRAVRPSERSGSRRAVLSASLGPEARRCSPLRTGVLGLRYSTQLRD